MLRRRWTSGYACPSSWNAQRWGVVRATSHVKSWSGCPSPRRVRTFNWLRGAHREQHRLVGRSNRHHSRDTGIPRLQVRCRVPAIEREDRDRHDCHGTLALGSLVFFLVSIGVAALRNALRTRHTPTTEQRETKQTRTGRPREGVYQGRRRQAAARRRTRTGS